MIRRDRAPDGSRLVRVVCGGRHPTGQSCLAEGPARVWRDAWDETMARAEARGLGWRIGSSVGGEDVCPACLGMHVQLGLALGGGTGR